MRDGGSRSGGPGASGGLADRLLALVGVGVVAAAVWAIAQTTGWIGRPFSGFLVLRDRVVAPVDHPSWPRAAAGVPYWARVTHVEGRPVREAGDLLRAAADAGPGRPLTYRFEWKGERFERTLPVTVFTRRQWATLFGIYLLNGVLFLALGLVVAALRRRQAAARALLAFCLSWGLLMLLELADFSGAGLRPLLLLCEAAAPATLLHLAANVPARQRLAGHPGFVRGLVLWSALLAAAAFAFEDAWPAAWMFTYRVFFAWSSLAVAASVWLLWRQLRTARSMIDAERAKIVLLGTLVAFAAPVLVLLAGQAVGSDLPFHLFPAASWAFPAAVGYAIVKRDLFEIDVFLRRAATYTTLTALVFLAYTGVLLVLSRLFQGLDAARSPWFALFFALGVLAVVRPARERLQDAIDRLFFRSRLDHAGIAGELSRALARTLGVGGVSERVREVIERTLAPDAFALLVSGGDGALRRAAGSEEEVPLSRQTRQALERGEAVHAAPEENGAAPLPGGAVLAVPVRFESHLEGVLLLGPKKAGVPYGPRDIELLQTIAHQTATALRNASSYERITELLASLESRVEERTRELERAQAELRASNERMRELDRMKTRFFSDASHELRTPLTLLLGPLEELRRLGDSLPPAARRLVELAHGNAAKLLVLSDTLLDLARLDAGGMQPVPRSEPLGPLVHRTAEPFRWLAEQRGLEFLLENLHEPYTAWCDPTMVSKIVGNLLANALKFTPSGRITVRLLYRDAEVGIEVADTGPGIPADELPFIFDRYRQASTAARSPFSGSGLGLALVRELTEIQNGRVEVESRPGSGSRFVIWLPAYSPIGLDEPGMLPEAELPGVNLAALAAADAMAGSEVEPPLPPPGPEPLVLLVDDNESLLEFVEELLRGEFRVQCARSAEQAMRALAAARPDVILSDVMMPGVDGLRFCENVKADLSLRHIPLVLLTARADLDSKLAGLRAGADDYITKPFQAEELKARLRALLRMRQMERELEAAYRELQQAQAQLVQAEKMASLGTLAAGLAHEINNPISFVASSIDLIEESLRELHSALDRRLRAGEATPELRALARELDWERRWETLEQNTAICRDGAMRAARIVRDLRTFCRPSTGEREEVDLRDCLEQALRLIHGESHGRITVRRDYEPIPPVRCDRGQMGQVFLNLLANAVHAIEGEGEIRVRTGARDGQVVVEIEDTGHGMDEATVRRIFDPFFTTKEVGKGTGLGLSIVRSLVEAHGGHIEVRSRPGEGTTFSVAVPFTAGGSHAATGSAATR